MVREAELWVAGGTPMSNDEMINGKNVCFLQVLFI